jgi:Zn finger protein HypA/HybF involved in hydrogenase expression
MKTCKCRKCRQWWGVSIRARIPRRGYLCPECEGQRAAEIDDGWRVSA